MSANNVYVFKDRVYLVTDTAASIGDLIFSVVDKTIQLPRLNAVAGFRGKFSGMNRLRFELGSFETLDELLLKMPEKLRRQYWFTSKFAPQFGGFELTIAGYCQKTAKPFAYIVTSLNVEGAKPFTMQPVKKAILAPPVQPDHPEDFMSRHGRNFDSEATNILQKQRQLRGVVIGWHAVVTTVDASGIRSRLLCVWPDKRGTKITRDLAPVMTSGRKRESSIVAPDWRNS